MSLYNRQFDENLNTEQLLATLGTLRGELGRFRDIMATASGRHIFAYTRIGGKNAPYYLPTYEHLAQHPWYDYAWDEQPDDTYRIYRFKVPQELREYVRTLALGESPFTINERFEQLNKEVEAEIDTPWTQRYAEIAKEIGNQIEWFIKDDHKMLGVFDSDTPEDLKPGDEIITI